MEVEATAPRLAVIGLDGGTWPVLEDLGKRGVMPFLSHLMANGSRAVLRSVLPPVTCPAWPVLATGLNPGQIGVFDFCSRRERSTYDLHPATSSAVRGRAFWDALSSRGYKVGILNYPALAPAYEVNGWMVAGLGATKLDRWAWPTAVAAELESLARPYSVSVSYGLPRYRDRLGSLLDDIERTLTGRLLALDYLLTERPVHVLVVVLSVTDVLSHTMWHLWDVDHPRYDPESCRQHLPRVLALWSRIDRAIESICCRLEASAGHAMIVSDHGFGPSFGVFRVNTWLEQRGYLHRTGRWAMLGNALRDTVLSLVQPAIGPVLRRMAGTRAQRALRASVLREIDLSRTRAFALETTDVCGAIFVNRAYARIHGIDESRFVAEMRAELADQLRAYGASAELGIEVYDSSTLYEGCYASLAPELFFAVDGFRASVSCRFGPRAYEARSHHPMKTGNHRQEGIFLGWGPKFRHRVDLPPISILDVAPTAFHLLGEAPPAGLDGGVALGSLRPAFRSVAVDDSESDTSWDPWSSASDRSQAELADVEERLRQLGYLD
jgi:predicted AlkP superfamily phosphohydrolase/phosphomutase